MSDPLLSVQGLHKRFGGLKAVNDLSLDIHAGEIVGLLGPNGSGKTTAINLISGTLPPNQGVIKLRGVNIAGQPAHQVYRHGISRTYQLVRLFKDMSLRENVIAGMAFTRHPQFGALAQEHADALLAKVGLANQGDKPAESLTYLDQKKVELARALASQPHLLLLDEWLAGLNPTELIAAIQLIASLREEGIAILMVEHVLDAVRSLCDRCVVMAAGAPISHGTPAQVLSDPEVIRAYLGDDHA